MSSARRRVVEDPAVSGYEGPRRMRPLLIALHGYTMNGDLMRRACAAALAPLAGRVDVLYPDAPHACAPESVIEAYKAWGTTPPPPPHLTWWRATDDGRLYDGWEVSRERLRAALEGPVPVGLFGFSQGASVAATIAALARRGALPSPRFAVLVAGGIPRADDLRPLFDGAIDLPSMHVWGRRDVRARTHSPKLAEVFASGTRQILEWHGPHMVPPGGEPARAIAAFMLEQLGVVPDATDPSLA